VRTPLLLVVGAFALVSLLMLGGWALTSGTPDVPARQAPAAGSAAGAGSGDASDRAEEQSQRAGDGAKPVNREQEDTSGAEAARARDLTRRARQRIPHSGAAGPAAARRSAGRQAQPLRSAPDQAAAERRRAEEAKRLADLRRAEQLRQAELARQEAAKRAEEAKRAADRAAEDAGADEPGGD
jgi:FtsZ-interacting cell division protein ZipA